MTKIPLLLVPLLLLAANAAQAVVTVSLQGDYAHTALPVQAGQFSMRFDKSPADATDEIGWFRMPVKLSFNGQAETYLSNRLAWFKPGQTTGLDLRFFGVFAPNDYLQAIVYTALPMFDGSAANPTLTVQSGTGVFGGLYYYQNVASGGHPISGQVLNASYSAAAPVPEVSAGWLLLLGLPLVVGMGRRQRGTVAMTVGANA